MKLWQDVLSFDRYFLAAVCPTIVGQYEQLIGGATITEHATQLHCMVFCSEENIEPPIS